MDKRQDVDTSALRRVSGAAEVLASVASSLTAHERDLVCQRLGEQSKPVRRARTWVRYFAVALVAGAVWLLCALMSILDDAAEWLSIMFAVASFVTVSCPAIQIYHALRRALDMAAGAYAVVSKGSDDRNG